MQFFNQTHRQLGALLLAAASGAACRPEQSSEHHPLAASSITAPVEQVDYVKKLSAALNNQDFCSKFLNKIDASLILINSQIRENGGSSTHQGFYETYADRVSKVDILNHLDPSISNSLQAEHFPVFTEHQLVTLNSVTELSFTIATYFNGELLVAKLQAKAASDTNSALLGEEAREECRSSIPGTAFAKLYTPDITKVNLARFISEIDFDELESRLSEAFKQRGLKQSVGLLPMDEAQADDEHIEDEESDIEEPSIDIQPKFTNPTSTYSTEPYTLDPIRNLIFDNGGLFTSSIGDYFVAPKGRVQITQEKEANNYTLLIDLLAGKIHIPITISGDPTTNPDSPLKVTIDRAKVGFIPSQPSAR